MKIYIYSILSLALIFPVFWGGIVLLFLEGDTPMIGLCLLIVSGMIFYFLNNLFKSKLEQSLLEILKELPLFSISQTALIILTVIILVGYGYNEYFEKYIQYKNKSEFYDPMIIDVDKEVHQSVNRDISLNYLGHAIVHFALAFLLFSTLIYQVIKLIKRRKEYENYTRRQI